GTVPSIPLIASSIMSKKIAAGAQAIVLDVKVGAGAFMETLEDARRLAGLMVAIGRLSGRKTVALLSDMNQPLGQAVGNALEVREAVDTLHGAGPADFREHCLIVASHMLNLGQKAPNLQFARQLAEEALESGRAWTLFRQLVHAQGGDVAYVDNPDRLPRAALVETVSAARTGYLSSINAREVGETSVELGAGRARKEDPIEHAVGIIIHHKVGDRVEKGQPLFTIHANDAARLKKARTRLLAAHQWQDRPAEPLPLFYGVIE
ncbi:MAG TPA: thymidine phosphorylase, partial [Anaerolineaceae bacterium]|nr:thymidine phosphorylase [Anaerolineaceae bacterium]